MVPRRRRPAVPRRRRQRRQPGARCRCRSRWSCPARSLGTRSVRRLISSSGKRRHSSVCEAQEPKSRAVIMNRSQAQRTRSKGFSPARAHSSGADHTRSHPTRSDDRQMSLAPSPTTVPSGVLARPNSLGDPRSFSHVTLSEERQLEARHAEASPLRGPRWAFRRRRCGHSPARRDGHQGHCSRQTRGRERPIDSGAHGLHNDAHPPHRSSP